MAKVKQLTPRARDNAQRRINRLTVGIIAASLAATAGIGAGIAVAAPPPKHNNKTDYGQKTKNKPATQPTRATQAPPPAGQAAPPATQAKPPAGQTAAPKAQPPANDKPESSSGDEQTTSGGS